MVRPLLVCSLAVVTWSACGTPPKTEAPGVDAGAMVPVDAGTAATGGGSGAPASGGGTAVTGGGTATGGGGGAEVDAGLDLVDAGPADASVPFDAGATVDAGLPTDAGVVPFDAGVPDAGQTVRFVAIGDTGKGNTDQFRVGAAIGQRCATDGCDFVVLLGDNFYPSGVSSTTDPQWQTAFVDPYAPVNAPFYVVLGNHDYGGDGAGTDIALADNEVAYSQVNPKWRLPAHHYKWNLRHVDFFAADTNRSMFSIDQSVRADFDGWLPASQATWKIVFAHHPYKSNGEHGNAGNYDGLSFVPVVNGAGVKRFVEERVCGRADFYITGHDHDIEWMQATCGRPGSPVQTQFIVSGGGAATTSLPGSQPTWYSSDQLGFTYIVIHDNTFTATFYDADGVQKYTRTVTR